MRKRPPQTVMEIAIAVGGIRKGLRVCTFVAQWTIAQQQLGHVPTVDEAATWWKEPRATWFLRLSEFREIFDLLDNPAPLASAAIARSRREFGRADVGAAIAQLGDLVAA